MSQPNMTTLMKRLEAATSRLEDLVTTGAAYAGMGAADAAAAAPAPLSAAVSPTCTTAPATSAEPAASAGPATSSEPSAGAEPAPAARYTVLDALDSKLEHLLDLSQKIDPELYAQVKAFKTGNSCANNIAVLARKVLKPEVGPDFAALFKPVNTEIEHINHIREAQRRSKFANHFSTVAEGSLILGWVSTPNPAEYVGDLKEAAQFYANKVLKEFKEDPVHKEWVKEFLSFGNSLVDALKSDLPDGLEWDPKGITLKEALETHACAEGAKDAPATAGAPAPPPPPSSAELNAGDSAAGNSAAGGMDALFAEISQGTGIHSTLKHIDRKNLPKPSGPKPKPPKPGSKSVTSSAPAAAKPPSTNLVNTNWTVENYRDAHDIVIEVDMVQTVFIENCERCTIVVKGKGTSVTVSNCKKVGVMVDTLISGLDFLGCSDCRAQTNGRLASLMLDKSNNMEIYLNEESLDVDIRTVNTWSINLEIPTGEPGDYVEAPIAEQISHTIDPKTKKVKSVAVAPGQ